MKKQLYWLSDAEWKRIEPLMPRGRRGAHGSMIVASSAASCICCDVAPAGEIARQITALTRRSTTASIAAYEELAGRAPWRLSAST